MQQKLLQTCRVLSPRAQANLTSKPVRVPGKVFLRMLANDIDHLFHDRNLDVLLRALLDGDHLAPVAARFFFPSAKQELGIVHADILQLKQSAAAFFFYAGRMHGRRDVGQRDLLAAFIVLLLRRAPCSLALLLLRFGVRALFLSGGQLR